MRIDGETGRRYGFVWLREWKLVTWFQVAKRLARGHKTEPPCLEKIDFERKHESVQLQ